MSAQLGISDRVTFLGWREDVRKLLSSWDLLVITSLDEGFPISALEAMAVGRPVLASQVGGLPELVVPGVTGELISSEDPEYLANSLARLANDREALARMGHEGWQRVQQKFSMQAMARDTALCTRSFFRAVELDRKDVADSSNGLAFLLAGRARGRASRRKDARIRATSIPLNARVPDAKPIFNLTPSLGETAVHCHHIETPTSGSHAHNCWPVGAIWYSKNLVLDLAMEVGASI